MLIRDVGFLLGADFYRVFGFLLGFSVASAYASYRLLEEYKIASALLQASVEELQASTDKVRRGVPWPMNCGLLTSGLDARPFQDLNAHSPDRNR